MDNRLKEIVDNFDQMKIGLDEPFKFHCTMCGKCCIDREDIYLFSSKRTDRGRNASKYA